MTDSDPSSLALAADFPAADRDAWRALVEKALKGVPYEKALVTELAEGIRTQPIYAREDALPTPAAARQADAEARSAGGWDVRTLHLHPDPAATNAAILADLAAGATSVALRFDVAGRLGHTALTDTARAGAGGVMIDGLAALDAALKDVYLEAATVALEPGAAFLPAAALMTGLWERRGIAGDAALGHLGADPLGALASLGTAGEPVDAALARMAEVARTLHDRFPNASSVSVDTAAYHAAGADEAMDLGYALATGVAYLRAMEAGGLAPEDAARQMVFCLPVGVDVFLGIAKLRAARALWARVLEACGVDAPGDAKNGSRMALHVTTAERAWAGRDAWVNMLRATVATFAAAVGGADSLTVLPYTHALGLPDGFARRIARNTQLVLKEESHLARVVDPAGGSWYVEVLTDRLAERAWGHFQAVEQAGGMAAALQDGSVAKACAEAWSARERRIARRREELTGVNAYPKVDEAKVDVVTVDRAALVDAARARLGAAAEPLPSAASIEDRARAAEAGLDLTSLMPAGPLEPEIAPLPSHRLGEAFEDLRDACDAAPKRPRALLLGIGGAAAYTARATFARSHLGSGGIEAVDRELDDPAGAAAALDGAGADLAVLCSSDSLYAEKAAAIATALKAAGAPRVWLAGRPGEHEAAWTAAGIDGYQFAGDDTLATLRGLLGALGVWQPKGGA